VKKVNFLRVGVKKAIHFLRVSVKKKTQSVRKKNNIRVSVKEKKAMHFSSVGVKDRCMGRNPEVFGGCQPFR
jgi:hypothetical protein